MIAPKFTLDVTYDRGVLHLRATPIDAVFDARKGDSIRDDKVDLRRAVVRIRAASGRSRAEPPSSSTSKR